MRGTADPQGAMFCYVSLETRIRASHPLRRLRLLVDEEAFGWLKTVGGLRKTKLIGRVTLAGQALLCFATYTLVCIGGL